MLEVEKPHPFNLGFLRLDPMFLSLPPFGPHDPIQSLTVFPHCSSAGREAAPETSRWIAIQSSHMSTGNKTKGQGSQWIS